MFQSKLFACLCWGLLMLSPSVSFAQKIVAHRGASHDAPENTLAAFRLAWEQNADAIEGDFFLTKDQQIVCIHDDKTKRTSGEEHDVAKTTLEDLRKLDVGRWKGEQFRGEKIPTIQEVLAIVPAGKQIYIEIKCGPEIVPYLKPVLEQSKLLPEQTIVISFNDRVIAEVRKTIPKLKAYWLTGFRREKKDSGPFQPDIDAVLAKMHEIKSQGLDCNANRDVVNEQFVQRLRSEKLGFHVWTVNDPIDARHFQKQGHESITPQRPGCLKNELKLP